jgi:hypothetical protein
MIPLQSTLENYEDQFMTIKQALTDYKFELGGNWDYKMGYFDRNLDNDNKVWLRIPFQVTDGKLDSESLENGAKVRLGEPFVLKHLYNEGLDAEASVMTYKALVDQFQDPVQADAPVESHWVDQARTLIKEVEKRVH